VGPVIRSEVPRFNYIAAEVTKGMTADSIKGWCVYEAFLVRLEPSSPGFKRPLQSPGQSSINLRTLTVKL
jgi:hypothetical protein